MNVLFTLAGKSSRFKSEGYKKPKFLLEIGRKTVLETIVEMFSDDDNFFFVFIAIITKIKVGIVNIVSTIDMLFQVILSFENGQ